MAGHAFPLLKLDRQVSALANLLHLWDLTLGFDLNKTYHSMTTSPYSSPALSQRTGLYDPKREHSACGVGFLTRKDGKRTLELMEMGHEALCSVPHRGGMSSEGVGDGAGLRIDLSVPFFSKLTGQELAEGGFGVGNFFMPEDSRHTRLQPALSRKHWLTSGPNVLICRKVPTNDGAISERAKKWQLPIRQWVFTCPKGSNAWLDRVIHQALLDIEAVAYTDPALQGLYPISLSASIQTLKGRLNSWEIVPYFADLNNPDHAVHTLYFHTRFSTNTDPHPSMAQPFRLVAHNGELNTDKKTA